MSADSDTHTAATAYGEVEIEVVECASCGAEVAKADAEPFTIGDDTVICEGWACEICADIGPADYPRTDTEVPLAVDVFFGVVFAPMLVAFGAFNYAAFRDPGDLGGRWYLIGVMGALFWMAVASLVWSIPGFSGAEGGVPL